MKKFFFKFFILFIIIDSFMLYYVYVIYPNLSGDMGHMGQIEFGTQYMDSIQDLYKPDRLRVHVLEDVDSINQPIITIGDSFSHFKEYGYSQALADYFNVDIIDISVSNKGPVQDFIKYANNDLFPPNTIVIVESVERSLLDRLQSIDISDHAIPEIQKYTYVVADKTAPKMKPDYLSNALKYMRKLLHLKRYNNIHTFETERDLFSHPGIHNQLYIFDSSLDGGGDIRYFETQEDNYNSIYNKLYDLQKLAQDHQTELIFLVAADKYDTYEPFIIEPHKKNPTLDNLPEEVWVVNSKTTLQAKAYEGVRDLYYINDTHWSPIGARIIANEVAKRINGMQNKEK